MENLKYFETHEQLVKPVMKLGGSGGVYVPKRWIGQRVMIKPLNINDNILRLVSPYMEKIVGIYLCGSYARGEETQESDIDILIITTREIDIVIENDFDIEVVEYEKIREFVGESPIKHYSMIREATPILNERVLNELKKIELTKESVRRYHKITKSALAMVRELLDTEGVSSEDLSACIYSLMMRSRGLYLTKCALQGRKYSNLDFENFVVKKGLPTHKYSRIYAIYRALRDNKKIPKHYVSKKDVELLYEIVMKGLQKEREKHAIEERKPVIPPEEERPAGPVEEPPATPVEEKQHKLPDMEEYYEHMA